MPYVRGAGKIRRLADYRFKKDWEEYAATLGGGVPKTVAEMVEIYETTVMRSAQPVEASVLDLLKRGLATSTDDPAYQQLIAKGLPTATERKLAIFETHKVDALVFPYQPNFAQPDQQPGDEGGRPDGCRRSRSSQSRDAGGLRVGWLSGDRGADGVRGPGAAHGHLVHGPALRRGPAHRLRVRLRAGVEDAPAVTAPAAAGD